MVRVQDDALVLPRAADTPAEPCNGRMRPQRPRRDQAVCDAHGRDSVSTRRLYETVPEPGAPLVSAPTTACRDGCHAPQRTSR
jgi:hypothetical protein